jgi:putative ABC transport system permease protein
MQAFQQLRSNKLRSALSLLGITIGIFCIIAVLSAVNSLEKNVRQSMEKLGDDVLYISKIPWTDGSPDSYWKYLRRPTPDHKDFEALEASVKTADYTAFSVFIGSKRISYRSSDVNGAILIAVTYNYADIFNIEFDKGRYFSPIEYQMGMDRIVIGYKLAEQLFGDADPINRPVKLSGRKYQVIGVIKESGNDLINPVNFDWAILVNYNAAKKLANVESNFPFGASLMVKAADNVDLQEVKDDVVVTMRRARRLSPLEENNFSINELSIISNALNQFFGVLNKLGWVVGIFAIVVGAVSVANIMFVSVKERTRLIGIKKALGAKRYMILLEFLIEAIILCMIGGLIGLTTVWATLSILGPAIDFELFMSLKNVFVGVGLSIAIGVASGFIPASVAAKMDPVVAMSK